MARSLASADWQSDRPYSFVLRAREGKVGDAGSSLGLAAFDDDVLRGGPLGDVAALDGGGHEIGEKIGRAGEGGRAESGEDAGDFAVETGRAGIVEGQQGDEARAAADEAADLF